MAPHIDVSQATLERLGRQQGRGQTMEDVVVALLDEVRREQKWVEIEPQAD